MRNFFVYSVEVQAVLFAKYFLIFPPEAADSSLAVLDFFLAHRAEPYVPCTSRHGLFAPRGIARSEIRLPDCEEKSVSRAEL